MMRSIIIVMVVGWMFFPGCKTMEPAPDVSLPLTLSENFSTSQIQDQDEGLHNALEPWWHFLANEELNILMDSALENNLDLKTLQARIESSQASIRKAQAAFFPSLGFSIGGQRKNTQTKRSTGQASTSDGSHSFDAGLTADYTPDLWGEVSADEQARVFTHEAAVMDLKQSTLELTQTLAQTWVDIIAVRNKKQILARQLEINETLLKLLKLRFVNGNASALDVSQQQEAMVQTSAQVPLLDRQERLLINAMALLSGRTTSADIRIEEKELPMVYGAPTVGIPADLLKNRPDIQAAKMRLSSSQWEITAAKADLFPDLTLTAKALFSSGQLDLLFQNWVATLAASLAGPVFDGGARRAEIDRVTAVAKEQLNIYAGVVAGAVIEVEDTLVSIEKQDQYIGLLEEELHAARVTLKDARVQYQNGKSSYLNYLVAWTAIQRLERGLVGEKATAVKERIFLHTALGGNLLAKENNNAASGQ